MNTPVLIKTYPTLPADTALAARFAGVRDGSFETALADCFAKVNALSSVAGKVCFRTFPLTFLPDTLDLGFARTSSKDLRRHLAGCSAVLVFAATAGSVWDRLIFRYERLSPSRALLFQSAGAAQTETLCDTFMRDMSEQYGTFTERFSPGYGDLALSFQRDLFAVLDPPRTIGVTLNESLLMSPTKSVTALAGFIRKEARP